MIALLFGTFLFDLLFFLRAVTGSPTPFKMAGGLDKGLASSMWSPISTGRPPYYFKKKPAPPATRLSNASTAVGNNSSPGASPSSSTPLSSPSATSNSRTSDAASKADTSITNTSGTSPSPTSNGEDSPLVAALNRIPTPWSELDRFTKIARRLKWKLPFLAHGYNTATAHVDDGDFDGAAAQQTEAELMFKLDFFEYYMLLERALVHLMGVFGVEITGAFRNGAAVPPKNRGGDGRRAGAVSESGGIGKKSDHRFHANVLEALDDARNPLNKSLGSDEVRYALARAKEREFPIQFPILSSLRPHTIAGWYIVHSLTFSPSLQSATAGKTPTTQTPPCPPKQGQGR